MPQRFGPWDDAVNKELLDRIKAIVETYRDVEQDIYLDADAVVDDIAAAINETEGSDL